MYFIALVLPDRLNEKVLKYKQLMFEKYKCNVGLKSPAHITIIPPFWMKEENQQQLIADIDLLSNNLYPFPVSTSNFSAFKPKTIFVAVVASEQLNKLKATTDNFFRHHSSYPVTIDTRPFLPHITIATRDLFKKSFYEIWPWFAEKNFVETWIAKGFSLLKHNKKNWDVIHTSQFNDLTKVI